MTDHDNINPFEVLGLPTTASNPEIVERGQELSNAAPTDEKRRICRWAIEQLITKPSTRLVHELFEVPDAEYDDLEWDTFAQSFARSPVNVVEMARDTPQVKPEDFDVGLLTDLILDGLFVISSPDFTLALAESPVTADYGPPPFEVTDALFG